MVPTGGRHLGTELDVRARGRLAVSRLAARVDVQVGQVALAQRDQVAEGTEVGLQVRDRSAVLAHPHSELGVRARAQCPLDADRVVVHLVGAGLLDGGRSREAARDEQVAAQHQCRSPGGREVGEDPPLARGQLRVGGPGSRRLVQGRVEVLEAGVVAAYHDQVQPLLVRDLEVRDRTAVRSLDGEGDRAGAGVEHVVGQDQAVAVPGDRQTGQRARLHRPRPLARGSAVAVAGVVAVVLSWLGSAAVDPTGPTCTPSAQAPPKTTARTTAKPTSLAAVPAEGFMRAGSRLLRQPTPLLRPRGAGRWSR